MNQPNRTYIIAEAGVNHNGSLATARELIDVAADAGADAVKFQTFRTELVISRSAPKAEYQKQTTAAGESQFDMVKKLELDDDAHRQLVRHCAEKGIQFLSTPFDLPSLDLLARTFDLPVLKLPSGEITNGPLLLQAARFNRRVILSTGMSTLDDIAAALGVLAFGYTQEGEEPSLAAFRRAFSSKQGQGALRKQVSLLHCTTEYPAPFEDVNLRAMETMRTAFGLPVGISDHTLGIAIPLAAVALGAVIIEKHFTLDRSLPGPDHRASLEPAELKEMVLSIRKVEDALGTGIKAPAPGERANMLVARKSLVASRPIRAGEQFTEENVTVKRPGSGISPLRYWEWLGKAATRDIGEDDIIV